MEDNLVEFGGSVNKVAQQMHYIQRANTESGFMSFVHGARNVLEVIDLILSLIKAYIICVIIYTLWKYNLIDKIIWVYDAIGKILSLVEKIGGGVVNAGSSAVNAVKKLF